MVLWSKKKHPFLLRKYNHYFDCLDKNGNGVLDRDDFVTRSETLCDALELAPDSPERATLRAASEALWQSICATLDEDGDGRISRDEFAGYFGTIADDIRRGRSQPRWAADRQYALLRAYLDVLDRDGDEQITADEFALYVESICPTSDPTQVFARLDLDGDGLLSVGELRTLYTQWVASQDENQPGNLLVTGCLPP